MNLENAVTMSQLAEPKPVKTVKEILSSTQVAYRVLARCEAGGYPYKHFPVTKKGAKAWAKKFLTSKEFQLMRINLNAAASPHNPRDPKRVKYYVKELAAKGQPDFDPIVVDVNRRKEGRTHLGYIPDVIVTDGKHRKASMLASGITHYLAWVGVKAIKKMKPVEVKASHDEIYLPPVDKSKIASHYEIFASTVPAVSMAPRQDTGSGGSRPKDHLHSGGPGSGRKKTRIDDEDEKMNESRELKQLKDKEYFKGLSGDERDRLYNLEHYSKNQRFNAAGKKVEAGKVEDCNACGARSTGSLEPGNASDLKIPPDQSDAGSRTEASDQYKWNPTKPQMYPSGAKPGDANTFGSPPFLSPGSGVGPRVINKGASKSEMSRTLNAKGKVKAAIKIKKMYTKKKKGGK